LKAGIAEYEKQKSKQVAEHIDQQVSQPLTRTKTLRQLMTNVSVQMMKLGEGGTKNALSRSVLALKSYLLDNKSNQEIIEMGLEGGRDRIEKLLEEAQKALQLKRRRKKKK